MFQVLISAYEDAGDIVNMSRSGDCNCAHLGKLLTARFLFCKFPLFIVRSLSLGQDHSEGTEERSECHLLKGGISMSLSLKIYVGYHLCEKCKLERRHSEAIHVASSTDLLSLSSTDLNVHYWSHLPQFSLWWTFKLKHGVVASLLMNLSQTASQEAWGGDIF